MREIALIKLKSKKITVEPNSMLLQQSNRYFSPESRIMSSWRDLSQTAWIFQIVPWECSNRWFYLLLRSKKCI